MEIITGKINILDANGEYHNIIAFKGDQGDPGPVPTEEVLRPIVAAEVAKVVAEAPEDFDTLKEIADWIAEHKDDAAAMNTAIQENARNIATVNGKVNNLTTMISGTLASGETVLELTDARITSTCKIDPYFWVDDDSEIEPIAPTKIKKETGKVTFTFDALDSDIRVGIVVAEVAV